RGPLERRGVEVRTGVAIARVGPGTVQLADGREIRAGTLIWTAGVKASPLAASLGVELTRGGRIVVEPDLSVPGHPEVWAIGDVAATPADTGGPRPGALPGPGAL